MDRFKFKLWDKRLNCWVTTGLISQLNNTKEYEAFPFINMCLQQTDGSLVEVYEGDVVETWYDSVGIISYGTELRGSNPCGYSIKEVSPYKRNDHTTRGITTIKRRICHSKELTDDSILEPKNTFYRTKNWWCPKLRRFISDQEYDWQVTLW